MNQRAAPGESTGGQRVFLAGPTAVGKSAVALALARRVDGEILTVDSMQVYRGLDIGTAKPSAADQRQVRHHLLDVVSVTERFDVARFVELARRAEADIVSRGKVPIFCGGSGLYLKAFAEGLDADRPSPDPGLRAELEGAPLADLVAELRRRDPATCARIDCANPRRVVRAVETVRLTGRPIPTPRWGSGAAEGAAGQEVQAAGWFGFTRSPTDLRARIDRRVDGMFEAGLVEETRRMLSLGLSQNRTAMQAIGYRQVAEHVLGRTSLEQARLQVKQRTWQLARRQLTWLRHQLPVQWVELGPDADLAAVADAIAGRWLERWDNRSLQNLD